MKIIAINGSHRKGKNTAVLLRAVLDEAGLYGASTELLELTDFSIKYCTSCNKCLGKSQCSIADDDMTIIAEKLLEADGIILGSPVYFSNVTALMKNFMDRTRWMYMSKSLLAGKVGAAITIAGLRNGGQDVVLHILQNFLVANNLQIAKARDNDSPISFPGVIGTLQAGYKDGQIIWYKSVEEDEVAMQACKILGENMCKLINSRSLK